MTTAHSSARPSHEYQPTIIETGLLIRRLAIQIAFLKTELKRSWVDFKTHPKAFVRHASYNSWQRLKNLLSTPHAVPACLTAVAAITGAVIIVLLVDKSGVLQKRL